MDAVASIVEHKLPIGDAVAALVDWMTATFMVQFRAFSAILETFIKGVEKGKLGTLYVWKDEDSFKKYIHPEENLTEEGEAAWAKVQPVYEELLKIQEDWASDFTDWKILF